MEIKNLLNGNIQEIREIANRRKFESMNKGFREYANAELSEFKKLLSPKIVTFLERNNMEKVWDLARYSRNDIRDLIKETFIESQPNDEECFYITETLDLILGMFELAFVPVEANIYTSDKEWNTLEILLFQNKSRTSGIYGGQR